MLHLLSTNSTKKKKETGRGGGGGGEWSAFEIGLLRSVSRLFLSCLGENLVRPADMLFAQQDGLLDMSFSVSVPISLVQVMPVNSCSAGCSLIVLCTRPTFERKWTPIEKALIHNDNNSHDL